MKRLLLVNPWVEDFTAYDLWNKPLGLLYLASFLRNTGFSVDLLDCLDKHSEPDFTPAVKKYGIGSLRRTVIEKPEILNHIPRHFARYGISEETFLHRLGAQPEPDAILVTSVMTYWYTGLRHTVDLLRSVFPGRPVILGGIYASLLPEHARQVIRPDYLVTGPGELKVLPILQEITGLRPDQEQLPATLDDYPYPAFDLVNHPDYLIVMTARGCPYDCSFCAQKQVAMPYTRRKPELVVDEFAGQYKKFRLRDFAFYDDALFIARDKHIKPILAGLIDKKLPLRLHSPNGLFAKYVDRELAGLMYKSGFKTICLSFETSNEARRADMYSKVTNDDMIQAVQLLTEAGFRPAELEAYVLMGLPGQHPEEVLASMLFVHNLGLQVRLASFSPLPGTLEFSRAVELGLIPADIDPLLTNKTIFPLLSDPIEIKRMNNIRSLSNYLNEGARRGVLMFSDPLLGPLVKNAVRNL